MPANPIANQISRAAESFLQQSRDWPCRGRRWRVGPVADLRGLIAFATLLAAFVGMPALSWANGREDTRLALDELRAQLGETPGRLEVWSEFLQLNQLDEALATPSSPDVDKLEEVHRGLERTDAAPDAYLLASAAKSFDRMLVVAGGEPAAADRVRAAIAQLDGWLNTRPSQADQWRKYLSMEELNRQFLPGAKPDVDTVRELQQKFASDTPGLTARHFADTREALGDWLATVDETVNPEEAARQALDAITQSFGRDRRRRAAWDSVLNLRNIRRELAAEGLPDEARVRLWRDRFAAEAGDETRMRFATLRRTIANWMDEVEHPLTQPLAVEIRAAKPSYTPPSASALRLARQSLIDRVNSLKRWLNTGPAERRVGWARFTELAELDRELRNSTLSYSRLLRSYAIFNSGEIGLENKPFADVRRALKVNLDLQRLTNSGPSAVPAAIQLLKQDLAELDRFLDRGGEEKKANWRRYLRWDELQQQLRGATVDRGDLIGVYRKFTADKNGLDLPAFDRVARGLQGLLSTMQLAQSVAGEDQYADHLEDLARAVELWDSRQDNNAAQTIAQQLQWLRGGGYLSSVVSRVEERFRRPNLRLTITERLVNELLADSKCQQDPVAMCLFGAWVTGTTHSQVGYQARLIPSPNSALLELVVGGTAFTRATGTQRRVGVHTLADTGLAASKQLIFTANGLQSTPAVASAQTAQRICGVTVNRLLFRRLIGRLAIRRAYKLKPCSEGVANCQARTKLAMRMDQQSVPLIEQANQRLRDAEARMRKQGVYPDSVHVRSTAEHVILDALKTDGRFVSTATNPPFISLGTDATVQVHQSSLNNILARRLGGVTIDNERIVRELEAAGQEVPEELRGKTNQDGEEEEPDSWSISLDQDLPCSVTFRDGNARFAVRCRRLTQFENTDGGPPVKTTIDDPIELAATYRLTAPDGYLRADRIGDVEISFVESPERMTPTQITYKTFLMRKIGSLFRDEFSIDDLPEDETTKRLRDVQIRQLASTAGWLALGVEIPPGVIAEMRASQRQ